MIRRSTPAQCVSDALYRRIERREYAGGSLSRTLHDYYSDAWQVLEVRQDSETNAHEQYVWGVHYIDSPLCRDRDADDNGTSLEERIYYLTDANMNVTTLVNPSGTVVERYRYDAYGRAAVLEPNHAADGDGISDYDNAILYAGYRYDAATGLYHVRFRVYHPTLGRWCQREPLGYVDGLNLYTYVRSFPTRAIDPTGRQALLLVNDWGPCDAFSHWANGSGQPVVVTGQKFLDFMRSLEVVQDRLLAMTTDQAPYHARRTLHSLQCGGQTSINLTVDEVGTVHLPRTSSRWAAFGTINRLTFDMTCRVRKRCCAQAGSQCRERMTLSCTTRLSGTDTYHNFVNNGAVTRGAIYGLSCVWQMAQHGLCQSGTCPAYSGPSNTPYAISWTDTVLSTYSECTQR